MRLLKRRTQARLHRRTVAAKSKSPSLSVAMTERAAVSEREVDATVIERATVTDVIAVTEVLIEAAEAPLM